MSQEDLANLNNTEFFDEQIKKMMDEMTSNTIIFIGLGIGMRIYKFLNRNGLDFHK